MDTLTRRVLIEQISELPKEAGSRYLEELQNKNAGVMTNMKMNIWNTFPFCSKDTIYGLNYWQDIKDKALNVNLFYKKYLK